MAGTALTPDITGKGAVSAPMALAFAVIAVILYGVTPLSTKVAVGSTDGITAGALRAVVAAAPALGLIIVLRLPIPWAGNAKWLLLASGVGGLALFPVLFSWGVQLTTAGHAAAGTAAGAVMVGVLNAAIERRWPGRMWFCGIAIGTAGALLLIWEAVGLGVAGVSWQGDALVFAGMFVGVLGYIAGARLTRQSGTTAVTLWSVIIAAILMFPFLTFYSGPAAVLSINRAGWGAICLLAWGTTILAYMLWNRALADGGIARMGALQLLQPVVGILLAPLVLGEPLTLTLIAATAVTLAGVALVRRG